MTKQLKEMILGALADAGGQKYLQRQADENPGAFLTLLGKVLPMTLVGDPSNPLQTVTRIEIVPVQPVQQPARLVEVVPLLVRKGDDV